MRVQSNTSNARSPDVNRSNPVGVQNRIRLAGNRNIKDAWRNTTQNLARSNIATRQQQDVGTHATSQRVGTQTAATTTRSTATGSAANAPAQPMYGSAQEAIAANNVPEVSEKPVDEFSVLDLPSGVLVNPEEPNQGELTIGQAAQQELYIQCKEGVLNGDIPEDDIRAQYVDAIEAKAALQGNYELIPYYEQPRLGDRTKTQYPKQGTPDAEENAHGQITYGLNSADAVKLIDEQALDARLNELWSDATIQGDYTAHAQKFIDNLPDTQKQALATELKNAIESPEYTQALEDMAASGLQEEATQLATSNLMNLELLDSELALEAQTNLPSTTLASELNGLLADPSQLGLESIELAFRDASELAMQGLRSGFGVVRHSSQRVTDYIDYNKGFLADKQKVTDLITVFEDVVTQAKNGQPVTLGQITTEDFQRAMDNTYLPANRRGGVMEFMTRAQDMGVWGTLSSGAMLASFGYKVANGAWDADSDATQRWGAARDLLAFGSVVGHVSKSGATVADSILTYFDVNNVDGNAAYQALGLDRTLPKLYGTTSFLPQEMNWEQLWKSYDNSSPAATAADSTDTTSRQTLSKQRLAGILIEEKPLVPAKTATKIVGTVTDLVGVADIVMGAIAAKDALDSGDRAMTAAYSLQAISGGIVASAGGIGTTALLAPLPAAVAGILLHQSFLLGPQWVLWLQPS